MASKIKFVWKPQYEALAKYNSERSKGIVHTEEWTKKMQDLQKEFDIAHQAAFGEKCLTS